LNLSAALCIYVCRGSESATTQKLDGFPSIAEGKAENWKLLNQFADIAHGSFAVANEVQTAGQQLHGSLA